jgi:CheY-like chemotaxis protein
VKSHIIDTDNLLAKLFSAVFELFAVSNAIMTAHGGSLWVQSSGVPGEGCVFGMELGVSSVALSTLRSEQKNDGILSSHRRSGECATSPLAIADMVYALVVDDSTLNRKMFARHLQSLGVMNITQACNGLEAVQAVQQRLAPNSEERLFDIIFMDCVMPVMGGNEAVKKIRELGYTGAIVTVTGNGLPEDVRESFASGSNQVLVKPVDGVKIEKVLRGTILSYIVLL